jgi:hypothetical protein
MHDGRKRPLHAAKTKDRFWAGVETLRPMVAKIPLPSSERKERPTTPA